MNIHVLVRKEHVPGKPDILGVVLDPVELAHLMYDVDRLPVDTQIVEREAMLGADGNYYWAELGQMVMAPVFSLVAHETTVAEDDAYIASLTPERRERFHPGHKPETEKKAERRAYREAAVSEEMLAKQNESNALALEVALELAQSVPDPAQARLAVAMATREDVLEAKRAQKGKQ